MNTISQMQLLIGKEINQLQYPAEPKNLYEPISYTLKLGGKRMRPLLVLLAYQLADGKNLEEVVKPALAVEIFHNFTLMHDDIMDEAPLRRGMPTVYRKWDRATAVLSGDAMLVKAYDLLLGISPKYLPESVRLFNRTAIEVCEGQQIDMDFEQMDLVSVEEYLNMIRLKTAVLLGFSLEYGALLAGMGKKGRKILYDLGVKMGLGFQLMDDLLDVYADQDKFGKQIGGDIVANKKTFLLTGALEQAKGTVKRQLDEWLSKTDFDPKEKVRAFTAIYDELGIKEQTIDLMNQYFDEAFALLDRLEADEADKKVFRVFALQLMKREK